MLCLPKFNIGRVYHRLTCKVFRAFPPSEQVILALNVTGGFQSGTTKISGEIRGSRSGGSRFNGIGGFNLK